MTAAEMDMQEEGTASSIPFQTITRVPQGRQSVLNAPPAAAGHAQREGDALGLRGDPVALVFIFLCVCFSFFFLVLVVYFYFW